MAKDAKTLDFKIVNYANSPDLDTLNSPIDIADNAFSSLYNIRFSRFGFGPRLGVSILGNNANTGTTGVKSLFYFEKANGKGVLVRTHTTWSEWLDKRGTDTWRTIQSGLTTTLRHAFAPFNKAVLQLATGQTADNNLLMGNGTDTMRTWSGAIGYIASSTATTITLRNISGSDTLFTLGFDDNGGSTGSIVINGTTYTYDGSSGGANTDFSTLILRGVSADPTGEAVDSPVIQLAATLGSNLPRGNVMGTAYGRLLISKDNAATLYYSEAGTETNFTSGNNYGDPGFETFIEGNGGIQAVITNNGNTFIFKRHAIIQWLLTVFAATTSTSAKRTEHKVVDEGYDNGCASPLSVIQANGGVFFITPKGQIRSLIDGRILTERILPSLDGFNANDAVLGYDPKLNLLYASERGRNSEGQTATRNDTTIVYDLSRNAISIWKGIGFSCFAWDAEDEKMLAGDVSQARVYQMNVQGVFSDDIGGEERVPINATAVTKRFNYSLPAIDKRMVYYAVQGYMLPSAKIQIDFRSNDGGSKSIKTKTITGSITNKYVFTRASHTIGAYPFGEISFGAEDNDLLIEGMNPFRCYVEIPLDQFADMEVVFSSVAKDGNGWWIRQAGPAVVSTDSFERHLVV